ncbi:HEAT repeat domain-containing protein [Sanguibacter sp. 4.1]|uniref:HEAT repeat domain-containing protein n=1 Tax=Sanguibacter biliveldensis TaxID=3030830 RepID=A0AAF0ZA68_9MICO|nr:HEAT repeat domain-containing protein [Sanguibacter sp. 4.1]WPF83466.1 HEAT repeat domain-containing protein [Sanguibacter sp. 4.1]
MGTPRRWAAEIAETPQEDLPRFLREHSGLPGPRANLALVEAVAQTVPEGALLDLACSSDEYLRMCGTAGLGRLLADGPARTEVLTLLRERAADPLWRVREAAAMALQIVGDADGTDLRSVVADWVTDPDPLVRRAAVAGICEPRLLTDPATRRCALDTCRTATASVRAVPRDLRTDPDLRTLRQALGYAWSVAIVAAPEEGLLDLDTLGADDDPDVVWILRSNLSKARLRKVLDRRS